MEMLFFNSGLAFLLLYYIFPIVDCQENHREWIDAYRQCKSQQKVLTPTASINVQRNIFRSAVSMWTSNYIVDLGCRRDAGLYVEQLNITTLNRGLCMTNDSTMIHLKEVQTYTNIDFHCAWDHSGTHTHPDSLLDITNEKELTVAMETMEWNYKYWIGFIGLDFYSSGRQCEVYYPMSNTSTASNARIYMTSCHGLHKFICIDGTQYRTAISLIKLSNIYGTAREPLKKENQQSHNTVSGTMILPYVSIAVTVLVLIGIIVTVFLLKLWISKLHSQMQNLQQQQRYTHPMYANEQLHMIQEEVSEPDTPISFTGSSIYANADSTMSNETNITVSYLTSTQVQHMVNGIQRSVSEDQHGNSVPVNVPEFQRPCKGKTLRHSAMSYKPRQRMPQNNRQISTEPASSRLCPFPDDIIVMENQWLKNKEPVHNTNIEPEESPFSTKNKPSPKPAVKAKATAAKNAYCRQLVESKCELDFYINSPSEVKLEDNETDDGIEDYENIWQN